MPHTPGLIVVSVSSQVLINGLEFRSTCRSGAIKYVEFHTFSQRFQTVELSAGLTRSFSVLLVTHG